MPLLDPATLLTLPAMKPTCPSCVALLSAALLTIGASRAQNPLFTMPPTSIPGATGSQITWAISGAVGHPFAVLADLSGGPVDLFGERLYLGLTPVLTTLLVAPASSGPVFQTIAIPTVPGMLGMSIFAQPLLLDTQAPNGFFRTLNGASTTFFANGFPLGSSFDDPIAEGFVGTFRADVTGHIRGGAVLRRTHQTIDPQGIPFPYGIANPLHPTGSRTQMVFRTQDVGAIGEPELLTAVRWHPYGPVLPGQILNLDMRIGHTDVVPDYTVDLFSALPVAPNSGLNPTFANNYRLGAPPVTGYQGNYVIDPVHLTASGYLPYPPIAPFAYDGTSSLLLEFLVADAPQNSSATGAAVRLMVQSSPLPGARVWASGSVVQPMPIPNPAQITTGTADNAMYELELDFARVQTFALSPWLDSLNTNPDYDPAIVAASTPAGSSYNLEFRGANTANGFGSTAWSASPDVADGMRYLQFRITFVASLLTGESPILDTVLVPAR